MTSMSYRTSFLSTADLKSNYGLEDCRPEYNRKVIPDMDMSAV